MDKQKQTKYTTVFPLDFWSCLLKIHYWKSQKYDREGCYFVLVMSVCMSQWRHGRSRNINMYGQGIKYFTYLSNTSELTKPRNCVKVEVAVLGSRP